ncbi:MAG: glycoside hydrolase family 2 TIM barrel-domain containing protein [Chthoniobacterales bacterium]
MRAPFFKNLLTCFLLLFYFAAADARASFPILDGKPAPLTGNIQVQGRQLLIDGTPFTIRSICYSPVPKGESSTDNLFNKEPTRENLVLLEHDFQMIQEAGFNVIRIYNPITNEKVLSLLDKYHLRTIVNVYKSAFGTSDDELRKTVSLLKNKPSTLIWEVGNEWNYNKFYINDLTDSQRKEYTGSTDPLELLKNAIDIIKSEDTTHPVSSVVGDLPDDDFWQKIADCKIDEKIELYGSNIYDGSSFGSYFTRWQKISSKPLYVSEFGATAFNANINNNSGGKDEASQSTAVMALLREIQDNLSSKNRDKVLVGGSVFEWSDEWWKGAGSPEEHGPEGWYFTKNPDFQIRRYPDDFQEDDTISKFSGPAPDHIFHEKWWGIVDIDRNKRKVYDDISDFYKHNKD